LLSRFNQEKATRLHKSVKLFYDFLKKTEDASDNNSDSLPELLIKNVDDEQIYQQLQLHNKSAYNSLLKFFSKCLVKPNEVSFNINMEANDAKKLDKLKKLEKRRQELQYGESTDDEDDELEDNDSDADVVEDRGKKDAVFGIPDGSDSEISDFEVETNDQDDDDDNEDDEDGEVLNEDDDDDDDDEERIVKKSNKETVDDLDSDEIDEDLIDMYGDLGDEKEVLEIGKAPTEYKDDLDDGDDKEEEEEEKQTSKNEEPVKKDEKKKVAFKDLFENDATENGLDEDGEKKSSFEKRQEQVKLLFNRVFKEFFLILREKKFLKFF
jgi:hypothetical protein